MDAGDGDVGEADGVSAIGGEGDEEAEIVREGFFGDEADAGVAISDVDNFAEASIGGDFNSIVGKLVAVFWYWVDDIGGEVRHGRGFRSKEGLEAGTEKELPGRWA